MSNIPYVKAHIVDKIIVDITYRDDTVLCGVVAHCIEYEPMENSYNLKVYETLQDYFNRRPILYGNVKKITVVGYST